MSRAVLLVLLMLGGGAKGQSLTAFADPMPCLISKPTDGHNIVRWAAADIWALVRAIAWNLR